MQYILMIHEDEAAWERYSEAEAGEIMQGYQRFSDHLVSSDAMLGGERLQPSHTATSVRVRGGETLLTDGPYAESKEQLGGFYIVDAPDLDAATRLAAQIPGASTGCVEVRPIWQMEN